MLTIGLKNIKTKGNHGVFKEELEKGNTFYTDVEVWYKSEKSVKTDDLDDTFDYQIIHDVVQEEMAKPSKLIEHLAGRIVKSLAKKDKRIKKVYVRIAKMNPPIKGIAEQSIVSLKEKVN